MGYRVAGVAGERRAQSAQPNASSQTTWPPTATLSAIDGIESRVSASWIVLRTEAKRGSSVKAAPPGWGEATQHVEQPTQARRPPGTVTPL